jgi:hypothetical protein
MSSHYKFLFLIIDSDGEACYDGNRALLRSCMNSRADVKTFFVRMNPDQTEPIRVSDDVLSVKGVESFIPGILEKTLAAMDFCLANISFDYLVRTNLSSFWDLNRLLEVFDTLPRSKCVSAITGRYREACATGRKEYGTLFPSGSGCIFSKDVIQTLHLHCASIGKEVPDDVALGYFLHNHGISIMEGIRYEQYDTSSLTMADVVAVVNTQRHYHYRVKGADRSRDNRVFQYLHDEIYKPTIYKSTIVSFYFNLTALPDATEAGRPQSFYMEKGLETLKLENPMVLFCDAATYPLLKAARDCEVPDTRLTRYIVQSLTDYDFYKDNWPIIRKNREGVECYRNDRNTASYFLTSMFKIHALRVAHQKNYFATPFYTWIDFGGSHVMRSFGPAVRRILADPRPKISLCYIHYRSHDELQHRLDTKAQGGYCGIAAGSITVEATYISRFYNGCLSVFHDQLLHGIGHGEEQVLTFFYDRWPELCSLHYGDYYSILTNYHAPVEDYPSIRRFFINEAVAKGRAALAADCARSVVNAVGSGLLNLDAGEVEWLRGLSTV